MEGYRPLTERLKPVDEALERLRVSAERDLTLGVHTNAVDIYAAIAGLRSVVAELAAYRWAPPK